MMRGAPPLLTALLLAYIGAVLLSTSATGSDAAPPPHPNVVIIISDDQGWNDVGYHGGDVQTPNIDRLAAEGVQLDRFYTYPICALSRAALMTGISSDRTRASNKHGLPLGFRILPQTFRAAGYQTWLVGKWHLGGFDDRESAAFYPHHRGFDHFYGHLGGAIDYWQHVHHGSNSPDWQRNGEPIEEEGYSTDLLADEATQLIESRNKSRPFLLVLSFNAVHQPLQSPTDPEVATRHIDEDARPIYRDMVESMDAAIGRVLNTIDGAGVHGQTLVVFLSDNGAVEGRAASNAPLRGGKGYVFEGGIRVPAIVHWPGVLPQGETSRQLMWAVDLLPTVAAAAGIDVEDAERLDGVNLWSQLCKQKTAPRDGFVINARSRGWAFFSDQWKLIHLPKTRETFLFRIDDDPCERLDVAGQYPDMVRELMQRVRSSTPADMLRIEPRRNWPSGAWLFAVTAVAVVGLSGVLLFRRLNRRKQRAPATPLPTAQPARAP